MIILINGPARSGKDTFAKLARKHLTSTTALYKISKPLKDLFRTAFSHVDSKTVGKLLEEYKDDPLIRGYETTPRDFQIKMYELLSDMFGEDVLGRLAAEQMKKMPAIHILVTDAGRNVEVKPIVKEFRYADVGIVILKRSGTSFEGDSREELHDEHKVRWYAHINNNHDLFLYEVQVKKVLKEWGLIDE